MRTTFGGAIPSRRSSRRSRRPGTDASLRRRRDTSSASLPPLEYEYSEAVIDEPFARSTGEPREPARRGRRLVYQWVDLDGEGISGILTEQADAWFYKPSLGEAASAPVETVATKPSTALLGDGRQQLLDLAGDGQLDLVELGGPTPGFFETGRPTATGAPFSDLRLAAERRLATIPNLRFVDLTATGTPMCC